MARYKYGYMVYRNDWRARPSERQLEGKYADLSFDLKIVNEEDSQLMAPLRTGDTVARLKWIANKTKPHEGWSCCSLIIEPSGYGKQLEIAKTGLKLVQRIVKGWGFAPEREIAEDTNYWYYVTRISDKDHRTEVLRLYEKLRDDYGEGRVNWLDPWALVLYAFPAMKIKRLILDQRKSEFITVDKLEEPGSDKWIDNFRVYDTGDGYFGEGAVVGCLAPNEQVAKARMEEEFFSKERSYGLASEQWQTRRQAWLDSDRPVISMSTYASWSYSLPVVPILENDLAVPSMFSRGY